jgi:hypothetical protein
MDTSAATFERCEGLIEGETIFSGFEHELDFLTRRRKLAAAIKNSWAFVTPAVATRRMQP